MFERFNKLSDKQKTLLALGVFVLLIAAFYGNTLANGFVFDDNIQIQNNEYLRSFNYLPKVFTGCLWEFVKGECGGTGYSYYRPTHTLSLLLTYQISSAPWIFHLLNLFYFFTGASLLFLLAKLLTKNFLSAFLAGFLFIIHPVNSEAANWIAATPDLLIFIFVLLTVIAYIKYRQTDSIKKLYLVYFFYFLALLSKEPAVLLPVVLLSIDFLFFGMRPRQFLRADTLKRYVPFGVLALVYFFMRTAVMGLVSAGRVSDFGFFEGIAVRVTLFAQYIERFFYPYPLSRYHLASGQEGNFLSPSFFLSLLVALVFFAALFLFIKRKQNFFAFSFIWFLVFLSPVLIMLILEPDYMIADRYIYLSGVSFFLIGGHLLSRALVYSRVARYATVGALSVMLIVTGVYVVRENKSWKNNTTALDHILRHYPDAHLFRLDRAIGWTKQDSSKFFEARKEFEEIVSRDPSWDKIDEVYKNIGDVYKIEGDYDNAINYYQRAVEASDGEHYDAINNIGMIYIRKEDYAEALKYFCQAFQVNPQHDGIRGNVARSISILQAQVDDFTPPSDCE